MRVLARTYDLSFGVAHAEDHAAALPYATLDSALHRRVVSLPFSDYLNTDDVPAEAYQALRDTLREEHPEAPVVLKTTYPHDTTGLGRVNRKAYVHVVPTGSHEEVEANMRSSFQRCVKQAKDAGLTVEPSTTPDAMSNFYALHRQLRFGKFGKIPQPRRFFEEIRTAFMEDGNGFVLQAQKAGQTVGALVALRHRNVLYYKFGASDKDALDDRPNHLLFDWLTHYAVDVGAGHVDLGLSGAGDAYEGLRRFKASFGGVPHPVTYFRTDPPGYDDAAENELGDLLGSLTERVVEHDLDPEATDAFSSLLYPYFA